MQSGHCVWRGTAGRLRQFLRRSGKANWTTPSSSSSSSSSFCFRGSQHQLTRAAAFSSWDPLEVQAVLRQVADSGHLQEDLLQRLRGVGPAEAIDTSAQVEEPEPAQLADVDGDPEQTEQAEQTEPEAALVPAPAPAPAVPCEAGDLAAAVELCRTYGLRDFSDFAKLGDRLGTLQASASELLRAGTAFADLRVLHPPLFQAMAKALLSSWPNEFSASDAAKLARVFAAQRFRHGEVFARIAACLRGGMQTLSPEEALSLLHSHAFLRLWPSEHSEMSEELWQALEEQAVTPASTQPELLLKLCHTLFLAQRVDEESLPKVILLLEQAAPPLLQRPTPMRPALRRRVLLLRSAMRYLHREAYTKLPKAVQQVFRKAHRMEPDTSQTPHVVLFIRKLSHALTKLKIGHVVDAQRGPFTFDIVERDRKIIYECNHFDRFYTSSTEKIASMCLQERIAKAMGYRVIQVPHWHWNKIKHKKQRIEYIRMSRYYALKDRRELAPRDAPVYDPAVNELDYLGEYFFKKDMPSSAWSWFQPRYDASKRIPAPTGASQ